MSPRSLPWDGHDVGQDKPPPITPQLPDSTTSPEMASTVPHPHPPAIPLYKFQIDYTPITSPGQRHRYKEVFNSNYAMYRRLYDIVAKVSDKFAELKRRLLQEEKDSEGYRKIKDQILQEYQESKKDKQYHEARKRFQYLHEMLSHIKKLVMDYEKVSTQCSHVTIDSTRRRHTVPQRTSLPRRRNIILRRISLPRRSHTVPRRVFL